MSSEIDQPIPEQLERWAKRDELVRLLLWVCHIISEFSQLMLHYEVRNVGSNGLVGR